MHPLFNQSTLNSLTTYFISIFKNTDYTIDQDDLRQEIYLAYCDGLESYTKKDGATLETFLNVHIRNRLSNLFRKHVRRWDSPCRKCPLGAYQNSKCARFSERSLCFLYKEWDNRELRRMSVSHPLPLADGSDGYAHDDLESRDSARLAEEYAEISKLADSKLVGAPRKLWLMFKNGEKLTDKQFNTLVDIFKALVGDQET